MKRIVIACFSGVGVGGLIMWFFLSNPGMVSTIGNGVSSSFEGTYECTEKLCGSKRLVFQRDGRVGAIFPLPFGALVPGPTGIDVFYDYIVTSERIYIDLGIHETGLEFDDSGQLIGGWGTFVKVSEK